MDAVLDLTAQTAAYIGVIQQLCVDHALELKEEGKVFDLLDRSEKVKGILIKHAVHNSKFVERSVQLIWINNPHARAEEVASCFLKRALALLEWLWDEANQVAFREQGDLKSFSPWHEEDFKLYDKPDSRLHALSIPPKSSLNENITDNSTKDELHDYLPTPEIWRGLIAKILYQNPRQRTWLAVKIHYMPVMVILGAGAVKYSTLAKRILQEWQAPEDELKVTVSPGDLKRQMTYPKFGYELAVQLLENQTLLLKHLQEQQNALPFELILGQELNEIKENRIKRQQELMLTTINGLKKNADSNLNASLGDRTTTSIPDDDNNKSIKSEDPILKAKSMRLNALAFSGGGIRSATFNLGVLQGFAKAGYLSKFDYLSTVSGGGYIGSWFLSWVKREASLIKVNDRLNPEKSTDPMAEEVRPIRWLRMYSNYLTPTAGIMSVDSWTVGMTLVRNMLLNQLIILLLFFTLLLTGRILFVVWTGHLIKVSDTMVFVVTSILIIAAAILAGAGMQFYNLKKSNLYADKFKGSKRKMKVSQYLLFISYVAAIGISAWLYSKGFPAATAIASGFQIALIKLAPSSGVIFIGLLLVALLGRYDKCIPGGKGNKLGAYIFIVLFSALAAAMGCVVLALAWRLIAQIQHATLAHSKNMFQDYGNALAFTLAPPLVLEVFSITIVIRMALLGIYFPDERREWWGRMGGIVHRTAFLWILIAGGATLVGKAVLYSSMPHQVYTHVIAAAGGWAALVLASVKAAFSAKSSDKDAPSTLSTVLDALAQAGPYLFGLGLLVFLPLLLNLILDRFFSAEQDSVSGILLITILTALITIILSWRIGINEFSMHHFYKNRLVRAYLGGTRSRSDRHNSSSPFTGFDASDDVLMSDLTNANKYYGPYPIVNTTLNASQVSDLDRQDRKAESFVFSPLFCGFDFSRKRASINMYEPSYDYGYRPTCGYAYPPKGPHLGSAMAISGAAADPNQGYHSSPATAFLLTAFNVRLGWWIGNPRKETWKSSDPELGLSYLISNLIGRTNTSDRYVSLSDGGHFDNMGLYELIRRRVTLIVLGDAEQDEKFTCEGLANAIRRCRVDFGVEINIDVTPITSRKENLSDVSFAVGKIIYPGNPTHLGVLIYLKSSITKNQPVDVREYSLKNPSFPHQSTGDQFFNESQFESYRKLGLSIVEAALTNPDIQSILSRI